MPVSANYNSPESSKTFVADPAAYEHIANDRNGHVKPGETGLGRLRREIMVIQRDINSFLTERMSNSKPDDNEDIEGLERKMLDGDEDENDEAE